MFGGAIHFLDLDASKLPVGTRCLGASRCCQASEMQSINFYPELLRLEQ